jgi:hypothetical protein
MAEYSAIPEGAQTQANAAEDSTVKDTESTLHKCLRQFRDAFDASFNERERGNQCRQYYDGFQWTADEIQTLRDRKQPVITANQIAPKINTLIGFEKRQRTDPKAYPRTPQHEKDAESATDALRYIAQDQSFDSKRSNVAENMAIEGIGAVCIGAKPKKSGEYEITVNLIHWDRFYRDPHSRERDFSDASFMGEVIWMDQDEALAEYPGKEGIIQGSYTTGGGDTFGSTFEDRPKWVWGDISQRRVRILKHRWKEPGKGWMIAILCRGGFLWGPKPSPYLDEDGEPCNDIEAVSAYVTTENDRYGNVWNWLTIQDEINKRRSKALHRLTMYGVVADKGAVDNVAKAKKELAKPDGWVEKNPDTFLEIRDGLAPMQGEMQLLQEAKAELNTIGVNPSLQGDARAPSGRAQELQQGAALSEYAIFFDALRHWSWRCYKAMWCRVRQYWDGPMWIRVTDDESNLRFVGLNRPVTAGEEVAQMMQEQRPIPPQLGLMAQIDPNMVTRIENPVSELDVDIIVEDGPDTVTVQAEQFALLVELKKADPMAIPTEMVIEASNLRNKERILEHLKGGGIPPQVQKQLQDQANEIQKLRQQAANNPADAISAQADLMDAETKQYEAQTERFNAETERERAVTERINVMTPTVVKQGTPSRFQ